MRVILSSDFQCDYDNLDLCRKSLNEQIMVADIYKINTVVYAGDLKDRYNPIDGRIIKFWMFAIEKWKKLGIDVCILLGNHDRFGLYSDSKNWLPILKRAGAETYEVSGIKTFKDNSAIGFLPYMSSTKQLRQAADKILTQRKWNKKTDILTFHCNLASARYNKLGKESEASFKPEYFHPENYLAVIGGDLHEHQKIDDNIYYTGSPFHTGWGEANQIKGYMLVLDSEVKFEPSAIPGWFDTSWPGFYTPETWQGTKVRIHVNCSVKDNYVRVLDKARTKAEQKYPGAQIVIQPEFQDEEKPSEINTLGSDDEIIADYVKETETVIILVEQLIGYLSHKLKETGFKLRTGNHFYFDKAECENVLSYKKLNIDFNQEGIIVVQGVNKDWHNQSNGGGKTNYLQPIAIAMFGSTFKEQKHDSWARRKTKDPAIAKLFGRDNRGRKIKIIRARRLKEEKPTKLQIFVNGVDQSTGNRNAFKEATQGVIERYTGFTWQTLANAVYIDQSIATAFLTGTKKERTQVISKFQNLERFEKALELVKQDRKQNEYLQQEIKEWILEVRTKLSQQKSFLITLKKESKDRMSEVNQKIDDITKKLNATRKEYLKVKEDNKEKVSELQRQYDLSCKKVSMCDERLKTLEAERRKYQSMFADVNGIEKKTECPTCFQRISIKLIQFKLSEWKSSKAEIDGKIQITAKLRSQKLNENIMLESELEKLLALQEQVKDKILAIRNELKFYEDRWVDLKKSDIAEGSSINQTKKKIEELRTQKNDFMEYLRIVEDDKLFFDYCEEAFSRDGIPAFLNKRICPILNRAAMHYSNKFADNQIKVRLEVENGEFIPRVINVNGGAEIEDQSTGEMATAGLITSFAMREIAPKTNLLILDEPGYGLSEENSRRFARALKDMKDSLGTVFITTHNKAMLEELEGEKTIMIVKENGVSFVN